MPNNVLIKGFLERNTKDKMHPKHRTEEGRRKLAERVYFEEYQDKIIAIDIKFPSDPYLQMYRSFLENMWNDIEYEKNKILWAEEKRKKEEAE